MNDLEVAVSAARAGGRIVAEAFGTDASTHYKGHGNPVTEVDKAAETAIRQTLATHRSRDGILGEEGGGGSWRSGRVWVVDPLDGTVNFVHGVPQVSVSVALYVDGEPTAAVVLDVLRDELFEATAGARLNGRPAAVSSRRAIDEALVATGFAYDRHLRAGEYARVLGLMLAKAQDVRRVGSAAIDLAWVACGRYDGYWERGLQPWDSAAGALLVNEAGGTVSDLAGRPYLLDSDGILATNGAVHQQLLEVLTGVSGAPPPSLA